MMSLRRLGVGVIALSCSEIGRSLRDYRCGEAADCDRFAGGCLGIDQYWHVRMG